jgi:hypothetical protein
VKSTVLGNAVTYVNAAGTTVNYTFSSALSGGYARVADLGIVSSWSCGSTPYTGSTACTANGGPASLGAQWVWGSPNGMSWNGTADSQYGYYVTGNQYNNTTGSPITANLLQPSPP